MKAVATVKRAAGEASGCIGLSSVIDAFTYFLPGNLYLEFVSTELDPPSGTSKTVAVHTQKKSEDGAEAKYEGSFAVPDNFGNIGGVLVWNENKYEVFLEKIVVNEGNGSDDYSVAIINCNSWVQPKCVSQEKRIFFTTKSFLPSSTPAGLQRLRSADLEAKRGDGRGERKSFEIIYDYDKYNDLGDPDNNTNDLARPVLGGSKQFPYPRRCRTGRPSSQNDPHSESRSTNIYVPRDEAFSEIKTLTFSGTTLTSALHAVSPAINAALIDINLGFQNFTAIDELYDQGFKLPHQLEGQRSLLSRLCSSVNDAANDLLLFEIPALIQNDKFSWLRDEEFARQTLAGVNPYAIELVKVL